MPNKTDARIFFFLFAALSVLLVTTAPTAKADDSAITPVPRGQDKPEKIERHEQMNERIAQGNVDLLMIGDSITQGWEGRGREVWEEFYGDRNAVNLGIGGDRTQHVLWRLENGNIDGISPKLAVIMIGTNNAGSNTPEEIAAGVTCIVEKLQTELPEMKILLLAIFPRGKDSNNARRIVTENTNAIIASLDNGDTIHYLDIGQNFLEEDGTLTRQMMPDLLHLNEHSYRIWAESMEEKVAELMGEE